MLEKERGQGRDEREKEEEQAHLGRKELSELMRRDFADTGANASAEEAEEALEDTAVKVNNVINSFRLQSTSFDKKSYLTYLKGKTTF